MSTDCCGRGPSEQPPSLSAAAVGSSPLRTPSAGGPPPHDDVVLSGATFLMGDAFDEGYPDDGETPRHSVTVSPFAIDRTPVTVGQFARFVAATGYRTIAERAGYSAVFHAAVEMRPSADVLGRLPRTPWWLWVAGANWRQPAGPGSSTPELDEHPVTHVAFADAVNYCLWSGRRLPSEAEWEFAARGGLEGARFPWGDELEPRGERRANIWVGDFPRRGPEAAGSAGTSRVGSYPPNGYGLFDMAGNVWEWTRDWFAPSTYARRAHTAGPASVDPGGSDNGHDRSIRGGSHLCHDSYCNRYRVSARSRCVPSATAGNLGFRTVA